MKTLYLFPAVYPYNLYGDNFLEDETRYLFQKFDRVVIIPYRKEIEVKKNLPEKCEVLKPLLSSKVSFVFKGLFSFKGVKLLISDFFSNHVYTNRNRLCVWIKAYFFLNNLLNRKDICHIGQHLTNDDICYFYWGKWGNLLSILWKNRAHFISRFHGEWDLWEEAYDGYTPLRSSVARSLDFAAFISRKGELYFKKHYPECRTLYAPLGTKDIGFSHKSNDGIIRVLSCSNVIPLKRLPLIFDSINLFSNTHQVIWTHIGGGETFDKFQKDVFSKKNETLEVRLLGRQNHDFVLQYYQNNIVDLFINLSSTEGIPVSIMEAISCNVPVVATDVGGVAEIVTAETGMLISANPQPDEVVTAMDFVVNNAFSPRHFWKIHYDADVNYKNFVDELIKL